jgi:hypothetical protein
MFIGLWGRGGGGQRRFIFVALAYGHVKFKEFTLNKVLLEFENVDITIFCSWGRWIS